MRGGVGDGEKVVGSWYRLVGVASTTGVTQALNRGNSSNIVTRGRVQVRPDDRQVWFIHSTPVLRATSSRNRASL
jgi:hypothetical protein